MFVCQIIAHQPLNRFTSKFHWETSFNHDRRFLTWFKTSNEGFDFLWENCRQSRVPKIVLNRVFMIELNYVCNSPFKVSSFVDNTVIKNRVSLGIADSYTYCKIGTNLYILQFLLISNLQKLETTWGLRSVLDVFSHYFQHLGSIKWLISSGGQPCTFYIYFFFIITFFFHSD